MRISDWISDVCSSVLVTEPKILLLDEPLSALDAHLKVRMQTVLSNLQRELGITFVYVTHSQSEAFSMADRVVIMSRGKIEQIRSEEHTSELQSLMRISYAVFCLKKKKIISQSNM